LSDAGYEAWISDATCEERIVAYADKRAIQRLVPIDTRFVRWLRRHPDFEPSLRLARSRAEVLEREICGLAGVSPAEIRRLRWVTPALVRAVGEAAA
jgi:hypothetical protein